MVRYALLGFGHHCERRLLPGFRGANNSVLTGLWRRDLEKAALNARHYEIPNVFATEAELCTSPEVDAVFVTSPDALHLQHVLLALKHGKHVICEKPLAMSALEVEQMLDAAHSAGVRLGVAQNFRYNPSLELIRSWIAEGRIGKPALAHAQFCYPAESSPRQWIYNPALACGGPIGDVAIHCLDALRYVLGARVALVSTIARVDERSAPVEAYASLSLDFADSAVGTVTVSTRGAYRSYIEVTGETAVITTENGLTVDHEIEVLMWRKGEVVERRRLSNADAYSHMIDGFSGWIEGSAEFRSPASDGLHNQQVLDSAYASWRTGSRQLLPPV